MKNKSTSCSAFFNPRVLILLVILSGGGFLALYASARVSDSLTAATAQSAQGKGFSKTSGNAVHTSQPLDSVQQAWAARFNGTGNDWDQASAIAVDTSGNVYVTGESTGSNGEHDYATIKYDPSGQQLWVARYNGLGIFNSATAIAVDTSGNVYVTGESASGEFNGNDYATIKYNSAGQQQWVARYNGSVNSEDEATAIAVDNVGNVYVTGTSDGGFGTGYNYVTIKYNSAGQQQWLTAYNGPAIGDDGAAAIVLDGLGNVYVTGASWGSFSDYDYATIKYDSAGQEQWVARYNGPGDGIDAAHAIAVDGSGNVYVTGWSEGSGSNFDYATIKYDASGEQQWVARYNGPGNDLDQANGIAIDGSGNVYVIGFSWGSGTAMDYATIKYDSAGQQQWVARYNGPGNNWDQAFAVSVDGLGNVYVTGNSVGSGIGYDYATVKYNPLGEELWNIRYDGPANGLDAVNAMAIDGLGNVYVTGISLTAGTNYDFATIKYVQTLSTPTPSPSPTVIPTATPRITPTPTPRPHPTPRHTPTPHPRM